MNRDSPLQTDSVYIPTRDELLHVIQRIDINPDLESDGVNYYYYYPTTVKPQKDIYRDIQTNKQPDRYIIMKKKII